MESKLETETQTQTLVTNDKKLIGRVKWFNNKAGYGFITITDGEKSGTDIFVHHSRVEVVNEQYRYLVQGEYVNFKIEETPNSTHEFQATAVSGINGGKLMCETRREFRETRSTFVKSEDVEQLSQQADKKEAPKSYKPRSRGSGPRSKDWKQVEQK